MSGLKNTSFEIVQDLQDWQSSLEEILVATGISQYDVTAQVYKHA